MIRAVTFDVGGTLIEPFPSVGAIYSEVAREFGLECCPDTLTRRFAEAWVARASFGYSTEEWFEIVEGSFRGSASVSRELFQRIYERFSEASAWRLFPDVLPALEALRGRGIRLAVVSNWDERLEPLLERLSLLGYFEQVTVSARVGWHKPDPQIFRHALAGLKLDSDVVLHVGDSRREDIEGATQAGLRALRISRRGVRESEEIESLQSILAHL